MSAPASIRPNSQSRHVEPESCPWPPIGNRVDPQVSADDMKAKMAALDVWNRDYSGTGNHQPHFLGGDAMTATATP